MSRLVYLTHREHLETPVCTEALSLPPDIKSEQSDRSADGLSEVKPSLSLSGAYLGVWKV